MDSKAEQKEISVDYSFLRWFLTWRYDILAPLITINGFSELMLKDLNGTLEKPLTHDDKRKYMGIVLNGSKAIRRALDFFSLYVRVREGVFPESILWEKFSIKAILEDVAKDLRAQDVISKVVINGKDEIPLIRTSPYDLTIVLAFLFAFAFVPASKEREVSVELKEIGDSVSVEINTGAQDQYVTPSFFEDFIKESNGLSLTKTVIELLDGKFEVLLKDKVLLYQLLLPIWFLSEKADEVIRVGIDDQSVELFLGQVFEIINMDDTHSKRIMNVVDFDRNVIRLKSNRGNLDGGLDAVEFMGIGIGSSDLRIEYSSLNESESTLHIMHVTVKPQISEIE